MIARIRTRDGFERLRRSGRRVRVDPLWCTHVHDPAMTTPAVAFAIPRTVGTAVARNRLRRRLRAVLADSSVPPGLLLIGATPRAVELTFDQLGEVTGRLLDRVGNEGTA